MPLISIVTPCYNEEQNVRDIYANVKEIFGSLPRYEYEHIFIDNASKDRTVAILKEIAAADKRVKIIVNTRNFGHIRSPFHALLQAKGEAAIIIAADLQEPPELIPQFIRKWEEGYKVVVGVKSKSRENPIMFGIRRLYYFIIASLSEIEQIPNFAGFGLYDSQVLKLLREMEDPYPYLRGIVCDLGFNIARVEFVQPVRKKGKTQNSFYILFDMAMNGITNYSRVPLRLTTMLGFFLSLINILVALGYFIYKIVFWQRFDLGVAPLVIGLFFFASVQLFCIGIIGEYIGAIYLQVQRRPLVVEKERINF